MEKVVTMELVPADKVSTPKHPLIQNTKSLPLCCEGTSLGYQQPSSTLRLVRSPMPPWPTSHGVVLLSLRQGRPIQAFRSSAVLRTMPVFVV